MFYNGNVDKFLHLAFVFESRGNGMYDVSLKVVPFSLGLYSASAVNYFRMFLEVIVVALFVVFVKRELDSVSDEPREYFMKPLSWVSMFSLGLCALCMIFYAVYLTSHQFTSIELPLAELNADGSTSLDRITGMNDLQFLSERTTAVASVACINICFIFMRCLALLAAVSPNWGLVMNSVVKGQDSFLCFIFIFCLLFTGFAMSGQKTLEETHRDGLPNSKSRRRHVCLSAFFSDGYLQFGSTVYGFSSFEKALLTCLRMVMGDFDFKTLKADAQDTQRGEII